MKDKWKIESGIRGPEKTAVKKKLISQVGVSKSYEFILVHTSFFCNFLKETICSFCSKKCVSALITERNGWCVKVVSYCKNCDTFIEENFTSSRMESTNSRQAAFVVNQKAVESTNDIQNITFGLKLTKVMKSVLPLMRVFLVVWKSRLLWTFRVAWSERMAYLTLLSDGDAKTWTPHNKVVLYGKF